MKEKKEIGTGKTAERKKAGEKKRKRERKKARQKQRKKEHKEERKRQTETVKSISAGPGAVLLQAQN